MLGLMCDKCRRRFTLADEELQGYLQQAAGKKHALVLCPHCGKGNKVAHERVARALSSSPQGGGEAETPPPGSDLLERSQLGSGSLETSSPSMPPGDEQTPPA